MDSKTLLYSTGKQTRYFIINYKKKNLKKKKKYIYIMLRNFLKKHRGL